MLCSPFPLTVNHQGFLSYQTIVLVRSGTRTESPFEAFTVVNECDVQLNLEVFTTRAKFSDFGLV